MNNARIFDLQIKPSVINFEFLNCVDRIKLARVKMMESFRDL